MDSVRDGGEDSDQAIPSLSFEIKRDENRAVSVLWRQAQAQAREGGKLAVLAYRRNRMPWTIRVETEFVSEGLPPEKWLEMSLELFAGILKMEPWRSIHLAHLEDTAR